MLPCCTPVVVRYGVYDYALPHHAAFVASYASPIASPGRCRFYIEKREVDGDARERRARRLLMMICAVHERH